MFKKSSWLAGFVGLIGFAFLTYAPVTASAQAVDDPVTKAVLEEQLNNLLLQLMQLKDSRITDLENSVATLATAVGEAKVACLSVATVSTSGDGSNLMVGSITPQKGPTPGIDTLSGLPTYEYLRANIENPSALRRMCKNADSRHTNPAIERICVEEHL